MVSVLKHFTVAFVRTVKPLLHHRLARVRLAALDCIQWLVVCPNVDKCRGSGTDAIVDLLGHRDENVIPIAAFYTAEVRLNSFAKLDQDANPQVRRAFYAMIQHWMVHLPDRYDHESRLMPYLLSAVTDELEETSRDARATLAVLGRMYEAEQGEEILEMKQYGLDGRNPSFNYGKRLPPPFLDDRPSLGTRLFVRSRTRRFLTPVLRELGNWQSPTRAHAVRLLKTVLVYSEEHVTVDAHALIDTLLRVWEDDELQQTSTENDGRSPSAGRRRPHGAIRGPQDIHAARARSPARRDRCRGPRRDARDDRDVAGGSLLSDGRLAGLSAFASRTRGRRRDLWSDDPRIPVTSRQLSAGKTVKPARTVVEAYVDVGERYHTLLYDAWSHLCVVCSSVQGVDEIQCRRISWSTGGSRAWSSCIDGSLKRR
ncbi:hypothetical protein PINS_up013767 [Pythium insidiosum]|nr:hypothetical protein PINS_up013767 [Pythium insidiosum]